MQTPYASGSLGPSEMRGGGFWIIDQWLTNAVEMLPFMSAGWEKKSHIYMFVLTSQYMWRSSQLFKASIPMCLHSVRGVMRGYRESPPLWRGTLFIIKPETKQAVWEAGNSRWFQACIDYWQHQGAKCSVTGWTKPSEHTLTPRPHHLHHSPTHTHTGPGCTAIVAAFIGSEAYRPGCGDTLSLRWVIWLKREAG